MARYARMTGWGKYLPERVLTNSDLEKMVDTSDEWIRTRTGIRERHIAAPGETCSTMSLAAARKALAVAQLAPSDVELIIVATSTPDYWVPSVASIIQDKLGAVGVPAFSLSAGCTGWVYALVTASQFIQTGAYRNALVIGTEHLSIGVDWSDRNTCVLFGDGSGAVVLEASDQPTGLLAFDLGSDGSEYDALIFPGLAGVHPPSHEVINQRLHYLRMDGRRVFKFATRVLADSVTKVVSASGLTADDIDLIIPHQANDRIIEMARRKLRVPPEKMMVNIDRYGTRRPPPSHWPWWMPSKRAGSSRLTTWSLSVLELGSPGPRRRSTGSPRSQQPSWWPNGPCTSGWPARWPRPAPPYGALASVWLRKPRRCCCLSTPLPPATESAAGRNSSPLACPPCRRPSPRLSGRGPQFSCTTRACRQARYPYRRARSTSYRSFSRRGRTGSAQS